MGRRLIQTFLQRRHTDSQQTHEKMLNIAIIIEMQIKITTKTNKWDLSNFKALHKKGNYKQGEKIALSMGENNSK